MDETALRAMVSQVAREELREVKTTREQAVRQLREWIQKHPDIRSCRTDDSFLLRFLRVKKFSVPMAAQTLVSFLKFLSAFSELTRNLDILDNDINEIVSCSSLFASPFRDDQGRRVVIFKICRVDPHRMGYKEFGRFSFMSLFSLMEDEAAQVLGFVYIFDYSGASLTQANIFPPMVLKSLAEGAQKSLPMRHKEIHLLNLHPAMEVIVNLCLFAMSKKIRDRVHLHQSLEQLHGHVTPKVLPEEYGGTMPEAEMNEVWRKSMVGLRDVLLGYDDLELIENNVTVETGAFRALSID